jgi:hypothetical protein
MEETSLTRTLGARAALRRALACVCVAGLLALPAQGDDRTKLTPGWNLFSPQDDIKVGLDNSKEAEQQLPMLKDEKVEAYLNTLGKHLAEFAPGEKYTYQFKCVNVADINAFALPGGFVYVNRGLIQAADNEAQLVGVIGHEISHVALRHGTSQVTKAMGPQLGVAVLGSVLGDSTLGKMITVAGAFSMGSLLLKYSRADESQADILGTQIAHDADYDPHALVQFFAVLADEERKMGAPPEFFSNHPSPEHRIERVDEEIKNLGGKPPNAKEDSPEFREIRKYLFSLPPAPRRSQLEEAESAPSGSTSKPGAPSASVQSYDNGTWTLQFPSNWRASGQGSAITLAPEGGVVPDGHGNQAMGYGMLFNRIEPRAGATLEAATDQLITQLRHSNPGLTVERKGEPTRLGGQRALSSYLLNDSPVKGKEMIWLVTTLRADGLSFVVSVAPQGEYDHYSKSFEGVVRTIHFHE